MERLAIVGTGLIGGSIGRRVAEVRAGLEVAAWDRDPAAAAAAVALGAATRAADSIESAVEGADLVVVAVPVDRIAEVLAALAPHLGTGAIVTDVGSAKAEVVAAGERLLGDRFVGGHPMAGSERHGIEAADPTLFEDAWWIVTPTSVTSDRAYRRVAALVTDLGARPVAIDPGAHDALVARLSHLPQLAAAALVSEAAAAGDRESLLGLAAGGFRDVTRIAASDPGLWVAILQANRDSVLTALDGYARRLGELRELLASDRWDGLQSFLGDARRARLELFAKPVPTGESAILTMLIPDRPGVLAEVTTQAGELGANIEDLKIFHSTEGGRGRLELIVAGPEAAAALEERLTGLGYHVDRGLPG